MKHTGTGLFCNWCDDLQHAMSARCFCLQRGIACNQEWCPVGGEDHIYTYNLLPIPTFKE